MIPLGDLQNIFSFAPLIGARINLPIKNYGVIGVGINIGIPVGANKFKYLDFDDAKINLAGIFDLQYTVFRYRLNSNLSLQPYFGIGYSTLGTDKLEEIDDEGNEIYYSIDAFDCKAGIETVYKKWGLFFEYHYATFPNSSTVSQKFGTRYFNVGIVYKYSFSF
jgi:hypothetical protein